MSVTREETITNLEKLAALFYTESEQSKMVDYSKIIETLEFAAAVLRPISREQVEKVWRGEWKHYLPPLGAGNIQCRCTKCGITPDTETPFCPFCGAPMMDEAVEMVMERLEALKDGSGD